MTDQVVFEALRGTRLAGELDESQCRTLAGAVSLRALKNGELLAREGTVDNHLYVILDGTVGIVKNAGTPEAVTINTMGKGDMIGELGFMDGLELYASKVALGEMKVLALERENLEALLHTHPDIVYRVMRAIIRDVHQIQRRLSMQQAELSNYIYKQHGRY
jgi:CRP/FNR family transcriptional regulator, cyclic AMP receptor protein